MCLEQQLVDPSHQSQTIDPADHRIAAVWLYRLAKDRCLPLLLQIPVFIALYSALSGAVELRHAPFMLWLSDMSAPDGLGITPILMGVSLYFQQKLTPTAATMDPMQQKIMQYLPLVFTIFTFTFPAGLTLYWLTSNLLSIAQQQFLNRIKTPELQD